MKRSVKGNSGGGHAIDEICSCCEGKGPKTKKYGSLVKKSEAGFNDMAMFPFGGADVFGCIGGRSEMLNTKFGKCVR